MRCSISISTVSICAIRAISIWFGSFMCFFFVAIINCVSIVTDSLFYFIILLFSCFSTILALCSWHNLQFLHCYLSNYWVMGSSLALKVVFCFIMSFYSIWWLLFSSSSIPEFYPHISMILCSIASLVLFFISTLLLTMYLVYYLSYFYSFLAWI